MRLKKYEVACGILAVIFLSFTFGYYVGKDSVDGNIIINTQSSVRSSPNNSGSTQAGNADAESEKNTFNSDKVEMNSLKSSADENDEFININKASPEELKALPGIGDVLSERIVEYRQKHGLFTSKEAITNVPGIGPEIFKNICDFIII